MNAAVVAMSLNLLKAGDTRALPVAVKVVELHFDRMLDELVAAVRTQAQPRVASCGALQAWHRELRRGVNGQHIDRPSTWRHDALMRAAAYEAQAADFDRLGLFAAGDRCRLDAARVLADAATTPARAAA